MQLLRKLLCAIDCCSHCETKEDATHIWGECVDCGKRYGRVKFTDMRHYIDKGTEDSKP